MVFHNLKLMKYALQRVYIKEEYTLTDLVLNEAKYVLFLDKHVLRTM